MSDFRQAYKNLTLKFTSGNDVPVSRAVITREEWDAINYEMMRLRIKVKQAQMVLVDKADDTWYADLLENYLRATQAEDKL